MESRNDLLTKQQEIDAVSNPQLDAFMEEIKELDLSNDSLVLLNAIISSGSGNIITDQMLSEKTTFPLWKTAKAKKPLANLGIITCKPEYSNNTSRKIGTRIAVNYDFKVSGIKTDKILSLFAEIDNATPEFSLQARGLLAHFVAKCIACQKDSFLTSERQECHELSLNIKTFLKYKQELLNRGVITCKYQQTGSIITINFNWDAEKSEIDATNNKLALISIEQVAKDFNVKKTTVALWVKKGRFPTYDLVLSKQLRYWKPETIKNFIKK